MTDAARSGRRPMAVCVTVDVEFDIAGTFRYPDRCMPVSRQAVEYASSSGEHGLGFLLDCLKQHQAKATFFVEVLNAAFFGADEMRRHAERIVESGNVLGLHLHPCWELFGRPDWREHLRRSGPPKDTLCGEPQERAVETLLKAKELFRGWGLGAPLAVRTGNLAVDRALYGAFAAAEMPLSSSIGVGIYGRLEESIRYTHGRHTIDGVIEVPVTSFSSATRPGRYRLLTITGTAFAEMKSLLWQARNNNFEHIVLLTHPSEFGERVDGGYETVTENKMNKKRLQALLEFVRQHPGDFAAVDMSGLFAGAPTAAGAALSTNPVDELRSRAENGVNDWLALPLRSFYDRKLRPRAA